jgi:flagellar assembly factor FliW
VKWLQSADSGELAFLMMDPKMVVADYSVTLGPDELAELDVPAVEALDIYTLVVVPADRTQIRTNLKAPILINPKQRLGKQMVLERSEYPVQFFLAQALRAPQKPQEVVNARTDS